MRTDYTDNEHWYLALTALWAARLEHEAADAGPVRAPSPDVAFAVSVLALQPGARVLDLACAWGRSTLELARRGYRATGFDISGRLLAIARARAAVGGLAIPFVEGTVRRLPELGVFDAVTAFYDDSLLSFEDEQDNLAALQGVARLLRPGGRLLFGTTDCPLILPPYQRTERVEDSVRIVEEITFDIGSMTGRSLRTHHHAGGNTEMYTRVRRHYSPDGAARLLTAAGLRLKDAWCAYDSAIPYGSRPEGMVVLAERP
ncbi:MAG: class I SAM-dependent methyltransferase [Chloroflexi bacterium]|nr:class I SAM-dependent methyltransferase [Chloroflexota bacterium]